jgi:hypothetical protein
MKKKIDPTSETAPVMGAPPPVEVFVPTNKIKLVNDTPELTSLQRLIDAYGVLLPQAAAAKKIVEEAEKLKKKLVEQLGEGLDPGKARTLAGSAFTAELGEAGNKRELLDVKAVHEILGDEAFYAIAGVGMADLDKYLSEVQKEKVIATTPTGPRKLNITARGEQSAGTCTLSRLHDAALR